jgi:hypothetical protein
MKDMSNTVQCGHRAYLGRDTKTFDEMWTKYRFDCCVNTEPGTDGMQKIPAGQSFQCKWNRRFQLDKILETSLDPAIAAPGPRDVCDALKSWLKTTGDATWTKEIISAKGQAEIARIKGSSKSFYDSAVQAMMAKPIRNIKIALAKRKHKEIVSIIDSVDSLEFMESKISENKSCTLMN